MKAYACMARQTYRRGNREARTIQPEDIERIRVWRNAQMGVLRQSKPIEVSEQVAYYAHHIWPSMEQHQPSTILMSYLQNGCLIGYGGLVHIQWEHRRAEVSFLVDTLRTVNARGYREDLLVFFDLMKEIAFDELELNRLFTETYVMREKHIEALEAANFIREGVLRMHVMIDGKLFDSLIHGCLKSYER
jgi:RimJ/RimL family protein N-acetyltransferase